jgi:hypothetical protein
MNEPRTVPLVRIALLLPALFAAGFLAGSLFAGRRHTRNYGIELESARAEQRRIAEDYQRLRDNYTRERQLNERIRTIVEDSTGILRSTDQTISGLRRQLSALRGKTQELKDLFSGNGPGNVPGGLPDSRAANEVGPARPGAQD